jgi:hypothetical protein
LVGGGCRLHIPRFPLNSDCVADVSVPQATRRLAGGGCRSHTPAFRCARLVLQTARYRGQRSARLVLQTARYHGRRIAWKLSKWGLTPPHPRFPLRSACLADGSLPRATNETMAVASNLSCRCTNEMAVGIVRSCSCSCTQAGLYN